MNATTNYLFDLINRVDVLAAALHRFHQLSFGITKWDESGRSKFDAMLTEWHEVQGLVWDHRDDLSPRHTIQRLVNQIVGQHPGINAELLAEFASWCSQAASPQMAVPAIFPKADCHRAEQDPHKQFERQSQAVLDVLRLREKVLAEAARLGCIVPAEVDRRSRYYVGQFDNSTCVQNAELQRWLAEPAGIGDTTSPGKPSGTAPQEQSLSELLGKLDPCAVEVLKAIVDKPLQTAEELKSDLNKKHDGKPVKGFSMPSMNRHINKLKKLGLINEGSRKGYSAKDLGHKLIAFLRVKR